MNLQRQSNPKMAYQDIVVAVTGAKEYGEYLQRQGRDLVERRGGSTLRGDSGAENEK